MNAGYFFTIFNLNCEKSCDDGRKYTNYCSVRNALGIAVNNALQIASRTALHIAILLFFTVVAERDVTKKFKSERSRSRRVTRP